MAEFIRIKPLFTFRQWSFIQNIYRKGNQIIMSDQAKNNVSEEKNASAKGGFKMGNLMGSLSGLASKGGSKSAGKGGSAKESSPADEIRKLTRTELLEMLIDETKEADRLREENERLQKELDRVRADLDKTASLDIVIKRLQEIIDRAR